MKAKITEEEFLELENLIKSRYSSGDKCIGFDSSGYRGITPFYLQYPLELSPDRYKILDKKGFRVYVKYPQECNNYAINLTRGETTNRDKEIFYYSII